MIEDENELNDGLDSNEDEDEDLPYDGPPPYRYTYGSPYGSPFGRPPGPDLNHKLLDELVSAHRRETTLLREIAELKLQLAKQEQETSEQTLLTYMEKMRQAAKEGDFPTPGTEQGLRAAAGIMSNEV